MSAVDFSDIELTAGFRAPVGHIFEALTNEKLISGYTQAPAKFEAKEGGAVSYFNGSIEAKVLSLKQPNEIQLQWRFKEWVEGTNSIVTIKVRQRSIQLLRSHCGRCSWLT